MVSAGTVLLETGLQHAVHKNTCTVVYVAVFLYMILLLKYVLLRSPTKIDCKEPSRKGCVTESSEKLNGYQATEGKNTNTGCPETEEANARLNTNTDCRETEEANANKTPREETDNLENEKEIQTPLSACSFPLHRKHRRDKDIKRRKLEKTKKVKRKKKKKKKERCLNIYITELLDQKSIEIQNEKEEIHLKYTQYQLVNQMKVAIAVIRFFITWSSKGDLMKRSKSVQQKEDKSELILSELLRIKCVSQKHIPYVSLILYPVFRTLDTYFQTMNSEELPSNQESMSYEWIRFQSFSVCSYFPVSPIFLSRSGFFYTGPGDTVMCFSCHVTYSGWRTTDCISETHRRISPHCPLLNRFESRNVAIHSSGELLSNSLDGQRSSDSHNENHYRTANENSIDNATVNQSDPTTSTDITRENGNNHITNGTDGHHSARATATATPMPISSDNHSSTQCPTNLISVPKKDKTQTQRDNIQHSPKAKSESSNTDGHMSSARRDNALTTSPNQQRQIEDPAIQALEEYFRNLDPLGINFDRPKYPAYAVLTVRISTFQTWPSYLTQKPREMAIAGYLYAGYGDYARCFFCGGGLRNWEAGDDPWIEHARWFPKCSFLRMNKGRDFILLVQRAHLQSEAGNDATNISSQINRGSLSNNTQSDIAEFDVSATVQSLKEMGCSDNVIDRAIKQFEEAHGHVNYNAQELLDIILDFQEGSVSSIDEGTNSTHSQPIASQSLDQHASSNDTESLVLEFKTLLDQRLCKVCRDADSCIAMLPCGHLVCCEDCAPAMRKCPACKELVKGTVKTYLM